MLMTYGWPGNVTELRRCMARAVGAAKYDHITAADVTIGQPSHPRAAEAEESVLLPLHELERLYIIETLRTFNGNKSIAARRLGVDRKTLARKLRNYQLDSGAEVNEQNAKDSAE